MAQHVCPWWIGYLLANPLRRLLENPERLLRPHIREGMTVLDFGSGMGYFTLPAARLVGPSGKVIALDIQEKMLSKLKKRAQSAGLLDRVALHLSDPDHISLDEPVDLALALYVVHETPDPRAFFAKMKELLKPSARMLVAEPWFHVSREEFESSLEAASAAGFRRVDEGISGRRLTALLERP